VTDSDGYIVMADHGQFLLADSGLGQFVEVLPPEDDSLVFGEPESVAVRTGAYAAPLEVRIESLDAAPGVPGSAWEDSVELSVRCAAEIVIAELMGSAPVATVASGSGWYRLRVSVRGRDTGEQRGEVGPRAKVIERYLIQVWPAPASPGATLKSTSLKPIDHAAGRVHLAAAHDAADRISRDLGHEAGHRDLSGATGSVHVEWTYRTTRRKLFLYAAFPAYWTSASGSGSNTVEPGARYLLSDNGRRLLDNSYQDIWDGIPTGNGRTCIRATLVEVDRPKSVVTNWQWFTGTGLGHDRPVLPNPTTLRVRLEQSKNVDGQPETTLHLDHDGLPIEWIEDMHACWLCKLEAGSTVYNLNK
jgi:hypothetical protein